MVDEAFNEDIDELYPNELHLRESNTQRVLIDSEFQKLIIAKSKISDLLSRLELVEKRHHWS
jgi:hypothetical protein